MAINTPWILTIHGSNDPVDIDLVLKEVGRFYIRLFLYNLGYVYILSMGLTFVWRLFK